MAPFAIVWKGYEKSETVGLDPHQQSAACRGI